MSLDKNDLKALIGLLQKLVQDNDVDVEDTASIPDKAQPSTKKQTNNTKNGRKRRNNEEHTNKFMDMPECNMHKDDTLIDQKLRKFPPTPRNRPATMINVSCRVCGKHETISSKMLPDSQDRYKCNKCSMSGG